MWSEAHTFRQYFLRSFITQDLTTGVESLRKTIAHQEHHIPRRELQLMFDVGVSRHTSERHSLDQHLLYSLFLCAIDEDRRHSCRAEGGLGPSQFDHDYGHKQRTQIHLF